LYSLFTSTYYQAATSTVGSLVVLALCEKKLLNFISHTTKAYNLPSSDWEFMSALRELKNTAPRPDNIHNVMLNNLNPSSLQYLLAIYNRLWVEEVFPESWREAINIPILEPGKSKEQVSSYRPISLTSCLCKLLERMINKRLMWLLESQNLLTPEQSGFRRGRSVLDHLVRLEEYINDAFLTKQHVVAILFDLEKAYDTTWRYGILRTVHSWGIRGHLPTFITHFLTERHFRVRVGNVLSRSIYQENGVPQGSVLSVVLFEISINSITACIKKPAVSLLFVDDLTMLCRASYLSSVERQLQLNIRRLERWSNETNYTFSIIKTTCIHFSRCRGIHLNPVLTLGGQVLTFTDTARV
jgi:Reverse transcriptase (RNA-dependent DNA polymerase)